MKPLVLVATASPYEWERLEPRLDAKRWVLRRVEKAIDAHQACHDEEAPPVLVIDSGLLGMARDPQWRELPAAHPEMGLVVRCLLPRGESQRVDDRTFHVDPDDGESLCRAVRVLSYRGSPAPR